MSFLMSRLYPGIIGHMKIQDNVTYSEMKRKSMETDTKMTQVLQLVDKGLKLAIIKTLKFGRETMGLLKRQKNDKFLFRNRVVFHREIEIMKETEF